MNNLPTVSPLDLHYLIVNPKLIYTTISANCTNCLCYCIKANISLKLMFDTSWDNLLAFEHHHFHLILKSEAFKLFLKILIKLQTILFRQQWHPLQKALKILSSHWAAKETIYFVEICVIPLTAYLFYGEFFN